MQLFANVVPGAALRERLRMSREEVARLRRDLRAYRAIGAAFGFLGIYLGVGIASSLLYAILIDGFGMPDVFGKVILIGSVAAGVCLYRFGLGHSRYRLCHAMLRLCRCASCGYSLSGISAEADGCTVCPECAAAWKIKEAAEEACRCEGSDP